MNVILPFTPRPRRSAADIAADRFEEVGDYREKLASELALASLPDGYYDDEPEPTALQHAIDQEAALDAHAVDMREMLSDLSERPIWDPQHQPDGRYYDAEAERHSELADMCHADDVAEGFFEHPDPAQQLVPDTVLQLLHNTVAAKSAESMVSAAVKRWMAGSELTPREQRIVDVVCDTNYASQIGRLFLPAS